MHRCGGWLTGAFPFGFRSLIISLPEEMFFVRTRAIPLQIVKSTKLPFDGDDWLFEIKHDGFPVVALGQDSRTTLLTRNGNDISRGHRHITRQLDTSSHRSAPH